MDANHELAPPLPNLLAVEMGDSTEEPSSGPKPPRDDD
jgi:hypothetical protein